MNIPVCFIVSIFLHGNLLFILFSLYHCSTHTIASFRYSGVNNLYPGDIIPFTRRPLFLIVDSDNSHAFKAGLSKLDFRYRV